MRMYFYLVLLLYVNSVFSFTLNQVMERLTYINDRVDTESKFRRDDFNTLFNEIGSLKAMMQQSLDNKAKGQDGEIVKSTDTKYSELEERVQFLTNGFKQEKQLNIRFRREIPELLRHVQDLKTKTDQISPSLIDILKGIDFLKDPNRERQDALNLIENDIPEIKENILNLLEQFEQAKIVQEESLNKIKNDTEMMKENIEHLKHTQELCLENINMNNNITKGLEEKLVSGEMFDSAEKNSSTTEHQERKCNCSISSYPENSTPSPSNTMPSFSCLELRDNGFDSDGIYTIATENKTNIAVYCDMTTDGGGWTVFQRRQDGSVDFFRGWEEYETGFGNLSGEFWLGNKYLNLLTDNDEPHELRIELGDHDENRAYAKYSSFKIMSKSEKFKLAVSGYTGNAGDSLISSGGYRPSDQMEFSTKDNDNDKYTSGNCASNWAGAWWFNNCFDSHLNGLYQDTSTCTPKWKCIIWYTWKGSEYSLKFTEMKFR